MNASPVPLLATVCLGLSALLSGLARSETAEVDFQQAVTDLITERVESDDFIGLSVGVARGDDVVFLQGFGTADLENDVPVTPDGVFRIGSITKMFTAVAILRLVEQGKLSLDDPLTKFLPDYPPPGDKITVRHLLQHTSGIVSFTNLPDHRSQMRNDLKHDAVLARIKDLPFQFQPGTRYQYCNSGYYLLGMIVETVTGAKFEDHLGETIFEPLGLDATHYDRNGKIIPNRVSGYAAWGKRIFNAPYVSMSQPFAAGALASTAGDLIHWQRALVNHQVLSPESFTTLTTRATLTSGKEVSYGMGCFVEKRGDRTIIRHGGAIPGFVSELAYFVDQDLTVVILSNHGNTQLRDLAYSMAKLAADSGIAPVRPSPSAN